MADAPEGAAELLRGGIRDQPSPAPAAETRIVRSTAGITKPTLTVDEAAALLGRERLERLRVDACR